MRASGTLFGVAPVDDPDVAVRRPPVRHGRAPDARGRARRPGAHPRPLAAGRRARPRLRDQPVRGAEDRRPRRRRLRARATSRPATRGSRPRWTPSPRSRSRSAATARSRSPACGPPRASTRTSWSCTSTRTRTPTATATASPTATRSSTRPRDGLVDPHRSFHIGVRDTASQRPPGRLDRATELGYQLLPVGEIGLGFVEVVRGAPVYVCWDMDVFDPSVAPGVVTPAWGGLTVREGLELIRALQGPRPGRAGRQRALTAARPRRPDGRARRSRHPRVSPAALSASVLRSGTVRSGVASAGGVAPPPRPARRSTHTVVMPERLGRHVVVEEALGDVQDPLARARRCARRRTRSSRCAACSRAPARR